MRALAALAPWGLVLGLVLGMMLTACGSSPPPAAQEPERDPNEGIELDSRRASAPDVGDEDDDGLAVEGLRGRLDPYDIQQGVEPHTRALERCFTKERASRRYLGGRVVLSFEVTRDGTVDHVHPAESDLGSWTVEQCLIAVGMGMRFPKPKGGAATDFTLPLDFPAARAVTSWNRERAMLEVEDDIVALSSCDEDGAVPADLWVTIYIGTRGQVQSVGFSSSGGPFDHAWANCAQALILAWTLTDPEGQVEKLGFSFPAGP
ncbi:AgmX/PglI C-terminal domain-containing protein [Haliangium sp.]|uniref:AgmX/PglI C-terminal domain-containing protein n=1 Tax=Haliangium sp. TaxID=2663208 RepID=UPI003D097F32